MPSLYVFKTLSSPAFEENKHKLRPGDVVLSLAPTARTNLFRVQTNIDKTLHIDPIGYLESHAYKIPFQKEYLKHNYDTEALSRIKKQAIPYQHPPKIMSKAELEEEEIYKAYQKQLLLHQCTAPSYSSFVREFNKNKQTRQSPDSALDTEQAASESSNSFGK